VSRHTCNSSSFRTRSLEGAVAAVVAAAASSSSPSIFCTSLTRIRTTPPTITEFKSASNQHSVALVRTIRQKGEMMELITCSGAQGPDPQDLEAGALLAPSGYHWKDRQHLRARRKRRRFQSNPTSVCSTTMKCFDRALRRVPWTLVPGSTLNPKSDMWKRIIEIQLFVCLQHPSLQYWIVLLICLINIH
jgi:hypothetical protein